MAAGSAQARKKEAGDLPAPSRARHAPGAAFVAPSEIAEIEAEWRDLAADAAEPNPFFAPDLLGPALAAYVAETLRLAIVRDPAGRLICFAPLVMQRGYSRLPVRYLSTWMYEHCFFAAPLIRNGCEKEALAALFDLVEKDGAFFRLRQLDADGPIFAAAREIAAKTGRLTAPSNRFERALLRGGFETDAYLQNALRGKKRKELRRLRNRLEEDGAVAFETLEDPTALAAWTLDFLTLENAGWKGKEGSALASDPAATKFFADALIAAEARGSLRFHRLTHDGKPIAMIVNFIENGAGFSFKIAYDEAYARYSPGVMLEIEMMAALEREPALSFIDSCAKKDHPMINSLWRERRTIAALNVSGKGAAAKLLFRILIELEKAGDAQRARAAGATSSENDDGDL